jgi:dTDP-4-amino-4,6-dideoxygalactose transaminase
MMKVPFLDLATQYKTLQADFDGAMRDVCSKASFILGPEVVAFEQAFADFIEAKHSVGLASGTDALRLAFEALHIGVGDEVIVPANTFVATAIGVLETGATPVLVDVDPDTFLMDYKQLEDARTSKTRAICPVHLYGRACDMDQVMNFAKRHGLAVVEDTAQAHGARWNGRRVGSFGDVGCFSFYPGKNLGAFGDAGGVVTNSDDLAQQIRKLRNYGSEIKYQHPEKGMNSRLDSIQAAILSVKLQHLASWNAQRWQAAQLYRAYLQDYQSEAFALPDIRTADEHVFHLFVIKVDERDRVAKELLEQGIGTVVHYPIPFHLQGGYKKLGYSEGDFPAAEKLSQRILSLPIYPEISEEQIAYVSDCLKKALRYSQ